MKYSGFLGGITEIPVLERHWYRCYREIIIELKKERLIKIGTKKKKGIGVCGCSENCEEIIPLDKQENKGLLSKGSITVFIFLI
ncbi:hypothetical protein [Xanthovirga aplysinae]|uniref:hypothetical protein n=1 Tax=Xanthovirga aplysinae TaxID=2529853 RepID=UPI0012BD59A0|nr:hypothetical protein [Xanthovirga aplysinae]MTI30688.1 hypothetical protein [Xanthovirga aplysinae]